MYIIGETNQPEKDNLKMNNNNNNKITWSAESRS